MGYKRKLRRGLKKRMSEMTPPQLVAQMEELVQANAALHTFNQVLVRVYNLAEISLEVRPNDPNYLSVRTALYKAIEQAKATFEGIMNGTVTSLPPQLPGEEEQNGTDGNGETSEDGDANRTGPDEFARLLRTDINDRISSVADSGDAPGEHSGSVSEPGDAVSQPDVAESALDS